MAGLPPTITDATVTLKATWATAGQYYGYCTVDELTTYEMPNYANYQQLSGNSGRSVVAQAITDAAMLDLESMIGQHYVLPYAGTDLGVKAVLGILNRKLAAANLFDRMLQGVEPAASPTATLLRHDAELIVTDILTGVIDWSDVTDITARARKPVFDRATGATIIPNPTMDGTGATPVFVIGGRSRFRPDDQF